MRRWRSCLIISISAPLLITGAWQVLARGFIWYLLLACAITLIATLSNGTMLYGIPVISLGTILAVLSAGTPAVALLTQVLILLLYLVMARDTLTPREGAAYAALFCLILPAAWLLLSLPGQIARMLLLLAIASLISGMALLLLFRMGITAGGERA